MFTTMNIVEIKRLKNSTLGNPTYQITNEFGKKFKTKANISDAYMIDYSWVGSDVEVVLTKAGTIEKINLIEKQPMR